MIIGKLRAPVDGAGTSRALHRVTSTRQPFVAAHGQPSRIVSGVPILAAREEVERGMV